MKRIIFALLLALAAYASAGEAPRPGFALLKKTVIGGDGGWDYLTLFRQGLQMTLPNRI